MATLKSAIRAAALERVKVASPMNSLWNDAEADACRSDLELRCYSSRLLGADSNLVLHGGGNTSVKLLETDITGEVQELLYVKGSGWDLASIAPAGFAPLRLGRLLKLAQLEQMTDTQMARELRAASTDPRGPAPSVEAILHALIPHKFVDHTHADALITITNTPDGAARVSELYGDRVIVLPYVMPGFALARAALEMWQREAHAGTLGMVLMNHGLFTFAETAKASYEAMIALVSQAETYLEQHGAWRLEDSAQPSAPDARVAISALRLELSKAAGKPMIVTRDPEPASLEFARREDVARVSQRGPATPDHVIRTKRFPLIGRDVSGYVQEYAAYFARQALGAALKMLDPAPRVVLDAELGMFSAGASIKDARIAQDIYRHTIQIIRRAERLGGWGALSERDLFQMEYWDLEQAKLNSNSAPLEFQGEVALVTGAASGIGKACAEALLERGAAVIGLDLNPDVARSFPSPAFLGLACDITDTDAVIASLERGVSAFGGLDMLILNAGIFPKSARIADLEQEVWSKAMRVNVDANLTLLRETHALLKNAPNGGRVVVNASKNVPAPGPGAAAYSASKAALTQLARVAALEWGGDKIRVNIMHPDAVFDTGLWAGGVLEARAESYGLSLEQYKTKNVLKSEVSSRDVAALAVALCGRAFARTTGAQVPVDGGNDRVI